MKSVHSKSLKVQYAVPLLWYQGCELRKWNTQMRPWQWARAFRYRFSCAINESPIPGTRTRPQVTQSLSWPSSGLFSIFMAFETFLWLWKKSETVGGETSKEEIATKIIPKVVLLKKSRKMAPRELSEISTKLERLQNNVWKNGFEWKLLNF